MTNDFTIEERVQEFTLDVEGQVVEYDVIVVDSGSSGAVDNFTVKVSSLDNVPGFLDAKLTAGSGVTLTTLNPAGDEDLEISVDETQIDHENILNIGSNTHPQIDAHISDNTIHYTQDTISIIASQVSDFDTEVSNNPDVVSNTAKVSFPEAPIDGNQYARQDGSWEVVSTSVDIALGDLSDVTVDTPTAGQIIVFTGSEWINANITEITGIDYIEFTGNEPAIINESAVWWNGSEYTLNVETGLGPTLQVGQETYILFYNDTGSTISNGKVLHPVGGTIQSGIIVPTVELADASDREKCQGTLFVATDEVADGALGFGTVFGKVRDYDTSSLGAGAQIWLSDVSPGDYVTTQPEFPSYDISMGGTLNDSATEGVLFINQTSAVEDTFNNAWDGSIRESFDFRITSDGTTVTGTLTNPNVDYSYLTAIFSDGFYRFNCVSPDNELELVPGTATTPQMNYVYLDKADKLLKVSTSEFPSTEHAKIAVVALLDAVQTQNGGAIRNQNTNDHIKSDLDNGHVLHIAERIRALNAEWDSGVASTLSGTPTNVYISNTSGVVFQMHKQTFPELDMSIGDPIYVINDPTSPYRSTVNLNDITEYSDGSTWNNEWSNLVVWGVCNKTGEMSHLMVNLPSDGYTTEANAIEDRNNFANYTIPREFKGVGFLIGRFTIRRSGTSFTYNSGTGYLDLRGYVPNNTAGGGTGSSGVTEFTQLSDTPSSYAGEAGNVPTVNSGETALEFQSFLQNVVEDTSPQLGGDLNMNNKSINHEILLASSGNYSGDLYKEDTANGVSVFDVVHWTDFSRWEQAQANTEDNVKGMAGIAVSIGTGTAIVLKEGIIKNSSWSFTVGANIFIDPSVAGGLTETVPSTTGQQIRCIGHAKSSDTIEVKIDTLYAEV